MQHLRYIWMKVSREKKAETRAALVSAAAELFVEQGFEHTTMKQIARRAGVGDATIYKYFPNKDKLITGFYDVRGAAALDEYKCTEGIEEYSFAEKLQLLVDTYFEQLMADREFIEITLTQLIKSPISLLKNELTVAKLYQAEFESLLAELQDDPDYPDIPFTNMAAALLTDCMLGLTVYWIKDESEEFSHTTQLTDLCITMIDTVLKSGLLGKAVDVIGFIVKTHLLRGLLNGGSLLSMMQSLNKNMGEFTEKAQKEPN